MGYAGQGLANYGDYYQGDYYSYAAGSIFGTIAKGLTGAVKGFVKGGPLGAIGGAVSAVTGGSKSTAVVPASPIPFPVVSTIMPGAGIIPVPKGTPGASPVPGIGGTIQRVLPGGASGYQAGPGVGGAPPGYHWNKSTSYARGLPAGSFLVRNRAMNPGNARALRRAIRRQQSFVALARRVLKGTGLAVKRSGSPAGGKRRARRR